MRLPPLLTLLIGFAALLPIPVAWASGDGTTYAWREANLAFYLPDTWTAEIGDETDHAVLSLTDTIRHIDLRVYPQTDSDDLRGYLNSALAAWGLMPLHYDIAVHFGRESLTTEAVNAERTRSGFGFAALLPDDRVYVGFGDTTETDTAPIQSALDFIVNSTVFSADAPPLERGYGVLWSASLTDGDLIGLAHGRENRLYALDPINGIRLFDSTTGSVGALYPFENPAQSTGIAADQQGVIAIGDRACRCIRRMNEDGRWIDPVGSFDGGAPHTIAAAPDGTLYGIDGDESEYVLQVITQERDAEIPLNFNPAAPPLIAVAPDGTLWVLEWLRSLMDDQISAAVSRIDASDSKAELTVQFWLSDLAPDSVSGFTVSETTIAFADEQRGILLYDYAGFLNDTLLASNPIALLDHADTIYSLTAAIDTDASDDVSEDDTLLSALSTAAAPTRFGGRTLLDGVPVIGILSENQSVQSWDLPATAGESVCIHAIDPNRPSEVSVGLDMALRLLSPNGSEIAYNDDQASGDLYGLYDAELCPVRFTQDGVYTLSVERRAGDGTYTLITSAARQIDLSSSLSVSAEGALQDAKPVERWIFEGHAGQSLTVTMMSASGDLDPALELYNPDGTFLVSNDDAVDTELGVNSQLAQIRLPSDGQYALEAGRWEGTGEYRLVIVITDP